MAKKKAGRPKGRPKGEGRITTRVSVVAKPEWLAWLDRFRQAVPTHDAIPPDMSGAIDYALRVAAEKLEIEPPPARL